MLLSFRSLPSGADFSLLYRNGLPVGADAHIKYKSSNTFGAVLMAKKPITLTSYNDETLFNAWLRANRARLSLLHGHQLRRYGLWLVTRTYSTPMASITAWDAKDKDAVMSLKAKANMMGEFGGDLEWTEKGTDKDWSHYSGKSQNDTVVVFFDGINEPAYKWWWENVKVSAAVGQFKRRQMEVSLHRAQSNKLKADAALGPTKIERTPTDHPVEEQHYRDEEEQHLLDADLWGSSTPLRNASPSNGRSVSRGRYMTPKRTESTTRTVSMPRRLSRYLESENKRPATDQVDWAAGSPAPEPGLPAGNLQAAEESGQRFSVASTATASSDPRHVPRPAPSKTANGDVSPPTPKSKSELHRKAASPSLRQSS